MQSWNSKRVEAVIGRPFQTLVKDINEYCITNKFVNKLDSETVGMLFACCYASLETKPTTYEGWLEAIKVEIKGMYGAILGGTNILDNFH